MTSRRIGLAVSPQSKPPVLQFQDGHWRLWTAYNADLTHGTYIGLASDGKALQVTIRPDGTRDLQTL